MRPDDITIAFFGSSHAYSSYDPRVFENEFNVNVFNYGAPLQNLITTLPVIRHAINKRNIKLGIVDIFRSSILEPPFTDRVAAFQYETLDYMELSLDKINLHNQFFGKENLLNVYPIFRDHALWSERIFQPDYVFTSEVDYFKGFKSDLYFDRKSWSKSIANKKEYFTNNYIDSEELTAGQKEIIDKIIALFRESKIHLIFVSAPVHKRYMDDTYYTNQQLLKTYLHKTGVPFIDYNNLWNELQLHLYNFKDISHLNSSGALKVSEHLANYIKEHYGFLVEEQDKMEGRRLTNRYFHIDKGFKHVAGYFKIKNTGLREETGIHEIAVFKDGYERLEIILTGERIKDSRIKVTYEMPEHETRNLPKSIGKKISGNTFSQTIFLPNRKKEGTFTGFKYKGREIKVLVADCPFTEIKNLKISIGGKSPSTEVIRMDHMEFKDYEPTFFP